MKSIDDLISPELLYDVLPEIMTRVCTFGLSQAYLGPSDSTYWLCDLGQVTYP